MAIYLNYFLLLQFAILAIVWLYKRDHAQAIYWLGAFICTAGVTFK